MNFPGDIALFKGREWIDGLKGINIFKYAQIGSVFVSKINNQFLTDSRSGKKWSDSFFI